MTKPPETDNKQRRKLNILAIFIAAIALVGACLGSVYVWEKMGQVALGLHGWLALIAGGSRDDYFRMRAHGAQLLFQPFRP